LSWGGAGKGIAHGVVPIQAGDMPSVRRVLAQGFPHQDAPFWEQGFLRWNQMSGRSDAAAPEGFLLKAAGADVGVLLAFSSDRPRIGGGVQTITNVSSWYVDAAYRWKAPMMLRSALSDESHVYTDLTPSPEVDRINMALGFQPWSDGMLIAAAAPWAAMRSREPVEIKGFGAAGAELSSPEDRLMLEKHGAIGCLAALIRTPGGTSPLLFRRIRRKGVLFAQLIYAQSRRMVIACLPAVMRFLLARGIVLLTIDVTRDLCPPGAIFRPGRRRFFKGALDPDRLDYAYSEIVALGI